MDTRIALISLLRQVSGFENLSLDGVNLLKASTFCEYFHKKYTDLTLDSVYGRSFAADLIDAWALFVKSIQPGKAVNSPGAYYFATERLNDEGVKVYGPFLRWLDTTTSDDDAVIVLKMAVEGKVAKFVLDEKQLAERHRVLRLLHNRYKQMYPNEAERIKQMTYIYFRNRDKKLQSVETLLRYINLYELKPGFHQNFVAGREMYEAEIRSRTQVYKFKAS